MRSRDTLSHSLSFACLMFYSKGFKVVVGGNREGDQSKRERDYSKFASFSKAIKIEEYFKRRQIFCLEFIRILMNSYIINDGVLGGIN